MEDRYQINGKIGQGGIGSVYRARDKRMNRDVAIKRLTTVEGPESDKETQKLLQEAGALASVQHPNIVTVYDVGVDDDGAFVVMELLSGETLEDIISHGSFIWEDFRRLAIQTIEALIAAQELHLLHRDLKPSNIMLSWLPSGKFQVKIVDFGLAKFSAKPSLQTIDQSDGVFGSIFFMAPEQFERIPLDCRVDIYAIGCVFYYALAGIYPFDGDNPAQVMGSHLQHHVTPLQEVRRGIPVWACDWIMWMVNRQPSDRPENAREALQVFYENDAGYSSPELSTGSKNAAWQKPNKPKLLIPGSTPEPEIIEDKNPTQTVKTATEPRALIPPETSSFGSKTSLQNTSVTAPHRTATSAVATPPQLATSPTPPAPETATQPQAPTQEAETAPPEPPKLRTLRTPEPPAKTETQPQPTAETATQPQAPTQEPETTPPGPPKLRTLRTPEPPAKTETQPQPAAETATQPQAPTQEPESTPPGPPKLKTLRTPEPPAKTETQPQPAAETTTQPQAPTKETGSTPLEAPKLKTRPAQQIPSKATSSTATVKNTQPPTQTSHTSSVTASQLKATASHSEKAGLSNRAKTSIAIALSLVVIVMVVLILNRNTKNAKNKVFNDMIALAADERNTQVPVDRSKLEVLLRYAASTGSISERSSIYRALRLAKATDGTDVDARITDFVINQEMIPDVRVVLMKEVLGKRDNPANINALLSFAMETKDSRAAVAAIESTRSLATADYFVRFLQLLEDTSDRSIRKALEENLSTIIELTSAKDSLRRNLRKAYDDSPSEEVRLTILRLMGSAGGDEMYEILSTNLQSADSNEKIAAIVSLSESPDKKGFQMLIDYLATESDLELRDRAYDAAFKCAMAEIPRQESTWKKLSEQTKTRDDTLKLIRGLANLNPEPWVLTILNKIVGESDHKPAVELAQRALERLDDMQKIQDSKTNDD